MAGGSRAQLIEIKRLRGRQRGCHQIDHAHAELLVNDLRQIEQT
jgi:UDP-N-acetylenolpyruvoylglucosamine reductase